jgi:hypothetical protein
LPHLQVQEAIGRKHGNGHTGKPANPALDVFHVQPGRNLYAPLERSRHWAEIGMHLVHALGGFPLGRVEHQVIICMDALDHQDLAVSFDLTPGFRNQPAVTGRNFARLQRATERAGQSASGRRDDIVEGGGVRLVHIGIDPIMLGDLGVHSEEHRGGHVGQVSAAQRSLDPFDSDTRGVSHLVFHDGLL